jgi:tetratricopeptide (TPR) repeat protein
MEMMPKTRIILTIVGLTALALLATACSPSAAKLTGTGNEAFAQQAYEEALRSYQQAQAESPALAEPFYNAANVLYREGKYEEALKELQKAASFPQADKVAQASLFNAGNSAYNTKSWEAAIESYRQALLRNPDDVDAKYNLELALQQQQQEQQQQKQDQQQQDQQNQDQQNQDQKQDGQGQQDQQQDQQNQSQDGQGQQDQQNKDQQNPSESDQGQPQDGQPGDQQQGQDGQPQDQGEQMGQGQGQPGKQQDGQPRPGSQLAPGQRMTQDQAKQLLAAIAGKSDTLQGRLGQILKVRSRPPVQDW